MLNLPTDANDLSEQRPLTDYAGKRRDVGNGRSVIGKLFKIGQPTGVRELPCSIQCLLGCDNIKRTPLFKQPGNSLENEPVVCVEKIRFDHQVRDTHPGTWLVQQSA